MLKSVVNGFLATWRLPRWRWALLIAAVSDALGFGVVLFPPLQWLLDALTVGVLFGVLGFRWPLLSALAIEAIPGLQVFPAWILVVAALAAAENGAQPSDSTAPRRRISTAPGGSTTSRK